MAKKSIGDLPIVSGIVGADEFVLRASGIDYRINFDNVQDDIRLVTQATDGFMAHGDKRELDNGFRRLAAYNWRELPSFTTSTPNAISSCECRWLAVGQSGDMRASYDGIRWLIRNSGTAENLTCAANDNVDTWISGGDNGAFRISTDNTATWGAITHPLGTGNFRATAYNIAAGRWVAAAGDIIIYSDNGTSWSTGLATGAGSIITAIAHNGVTGGSEVWVAVFEDGKVYTSADGASWSLDTTLGFNPHAIAFDPEETAASSGWMIGGHDAGFTSGKVAYGAPGAWNEAGSSTPGDADYIEPTINGVTSNGKDVWILTGTDGSNRGFILTVGTGSQSGPYINRHYKSATSYNGVAVDENGMAIVVGRDASNASYVLSLGVW